MEVNGQIFGDIRGDKTTIFLENDEVVTAVEFYRCYTDNICALTMFTKISTETQKQYGPYSTKRTSLFNYERVYGEIPVNMSFRDFLAEFSFTTGNYWKQITIRLPPWTSENKGYS